MEQRWRVGLTLVAVAAGPSSKITTTRALTTRYTFDSTDHLLNRHEVDPDLSSLWAFSKKTFHVAATV
jgi:hypothetical protein